MFDRSDYAELISMSSTPNCKYCWNTWFGGNYWKVLDNINKSHRKKTAKEMIFTKKYLHQRCFPDSFAHFFKIAFLIEYLQAKLFRVIAAVILLFCYSSLLVIIYNKFCTQPIELQRSGSLLFSHDQSECTNVSHN